jgi:hypothetical protein
MDWLFIMSGCALREDKVYIVLGDALTDQQPQELVWTLD